MRLIKAIIKKPEMVMDGVLVTLMIGVTATLVWVFSFAPYKLALVKKQEQVERLSVRAPNIPETGSDGKRHAIGEFSGRPLLLIFWSSKCPWCRLDIPKVEAFRAKHLSLAALGVNTGDLMADVAQYSSANRFSFATVPDADGSLKKLFNVEATPTYVLIDESGVARLKFRGIGVADAKAFKELITKWATSR